MNETLASPPPATTARGFFTRMWDDPDGRSSLVGATGVIIFYLLLWVFGPRLLRIEQVPVTNRPHATAQQFNIELAPETFVPKPPPPPPNKFVETNPDAPENTPDKTNNFSDRNQQVAQEKPTPNSQSDRPALEGKKDFESTQIVSGSLAKPEEQPAPPPPIEAAREATASPPKAEQNPLPGLEKKMGDDGNFGSNIAKIPDNARPIPNKIEGQKDAPLIDDATANQPAIDPHHPRARPQIVKQQHVRPAIFAENKFGTQNIGNIAVDARWSNYGAYLQRMIDTVQIQWERLLDNSQLYPGSGTYVTVKFIMDSTGSITQIVNVDNHSTDAGSKICVNAITERAPYGEWTDDMKAVLGTRQEMTFTFYYQ